MDKKNDILDAWIMVELLSEGNIKPNEKSFKTFEDTKDSNDREL